MNLTPHAGNLCPCHPDVVVLYALHGDPGVVRIEKASALHWGAGPLAEEPNAGRIRGWRVLVAAPRKPREVSRIGRHDAEGVPYLHCDRVIVA